MPASNPQTSDGPTYSPAVRARRRTLASLAGHVAAITGGGSFSSNDRSLHRAVVVRYNARRRAEPL